MTGHFIEEGKKFVNGPPESAGLATKAGWVTIDDKPVFIGGPSQGSGASGGDITVQKVKGHNVYTIPKGTPIPKDLRHQKAYIAFDQEEGTMHIASAKEDAEIFHADIVSAVGKGSRYDQLVRATQFTGGRLFVNSLRSGVGRDWQSVTDVEVDERATKNLKRFKTFLLEGGYPPDTSVSWGTQSSGTIHLELEDIKELGEKDWVTIDDKPVFIGGPSQGAGSGGDSVTITKPTEEQAEAWKKEIEDTWESGPRQGNGYTAIQETQFAGMEVVALTEAGELKGVASIDTPTKRTNFLTGEEYYSRSSMSIYHLATKERGYGRAMMEAILSHAATNDWEVAWNATEESEGFYRAIGLEPTFGRTFIISAEEAKEWLLSQKSLKTDPSDPAYTLEPESGVFTNGARPPQTPEQKGWVTIDDKPVFIGGPGQGSGSGSGSANGGVQKSDLPNTTMYSAPKSVEIPEEVRNQEALIAYDPENQILHVAPFEQTEFTTPDRTTHADMIGAAGRSSAFDDFIRCRGDDSNLTFDTVAAGIGTELGRSVHSQGRAIEADEVASRNLRVLKNALISAGYDPSTPTTWHTATGAIVDVPLEDIKALTNKRWITVDEQPIFIGGPSQGTGASSSTDFPEAATTGRITSSEELGGGICDSELVHYEDDGTGVWKEIEEARGHHDGNSEVAAYRINRLMGGDEVPTTVFSSKEADGTPVQGTSQEFILGAKMAMGIPYVTPAELADVPHSTIERVFALDIIVGNPDRHHGNWLMKDGNLIAIDHGHSSWDLWEGGRKTAGWRNKLWHAWNVAKRKVSSQTFDDDPVSILDCRGERSGRFIFSEASISRWSRITREQFDQALTGIDQSRNVNLDNAWANLQHIIENGEVTW